MRRRDFLKIVAAYGTATALGPASGQSTLTNTSQSAMVGAAPGSPPGTTTFSVHTESGHWSVASRAQRLSRVSSQMNGQSIFLGCEVKDATFRKIIDRLEVTAEFAVVRGRWLQVSFRVFNPTAAPLPITSFEPLLARLDDALLGSSSDDLRIMWESATYEVGRATDHESHYYAVLYSDKDRFGSAWTVMYKPPQLWTSMFRKQGGDLTGFVNLRNRTLPVDPGETIRFDSILLSAEFTSMEGWQAIGRFYEPTMPLSDAISHSGFNTWDYFRGEISTQALSPVLASLQTFNRDSIAKLRYFTLDDGWFPQRGNWVFDLHKFPEGESGWAEIVRKAGMEPVCG